MIRGSPKEGGSAVRTSRVAGEGYVKFKSRSVRGVCMDGEVERDGASAASDKREDKAACIIHTHAPSPKAVTLNSDKDISIL